MKLAEAREFALALPQVTEEPHHTYSSFRSSGRIFATVPPEGDRIHIFPDESTREQALAMYPHFAEKLQWGDKVVGVEIALSLAEASAVKSLIRAAWQHKSPRAAAPARPSRSRPKPK